MRPDGSRAVTTEPGGVTWATRYGPEWARRWSELAVVAADAASTAAVDDRCYELLREMKVFRTLLPRRLSGMEADPLDAMALVEDLASLSGTIGWVSFVGITGAIFAMELDAEAAGEIYADPDVLVAYAGVASGVLTRHGDDFTLFGRWDVASGLSHARWVAVGCEIADDEGASNAAVAVLPRMDCDVSFGWDPIGLSGTGTGAIVIDGVTVAANRVVRERAREADHRHRRRYRLLIPSMMASVSLGVAQAALDDVAGWLSREPATVARIRRADSEHVQHLLGRAHAEVRSARAFLREVTAESWRRACLGDDLGLRHGALHRLAATHAATVAVEASSAVEALAGTRAVTRSDPACRRWIDARTIAANVTVRDLYYQVYGGVAAGGAIPATWP